MKKIKIDENTRKFNRKDIVVGYLNENNIEQIKFEIPEQYENYNKKVCLKSGNDTFAKLLDENDILTLTSDITKYKKIDLSIEFFDNKNNIIARTSKLSIIIEDTIISEDVTPTEPKVIILNELIEKVNNLDIDLEDTTIIITKKDGSKKSVSVKGEKGDKGDPGKFQVHIVEELPTTGEDGVMYLVKKETSSIDDLYNEYLYTDGKWNLIGNTHVDLSDYYMKSETYSIEEVHDLIDEIEAGVELYGTFEDGILSLSLLDNASTQLSKIDIEMPQNQELHYTWNGAIDDEAIDIFQMVYGYYRTGKIINVDLQYKGKLYKLTNISNPANKGNELYCQFMTLDYYTDKTDFVFMQSVNAVLTLNSGIVEDVSINESIDKFRLIREYDGSNGALPTNNTKEYIPTMPYEPATKKYVDETHYKYISGYKTSGTQVLKNINGVLTWINE